MRCFLTVKAASPRQKSYVEVRLLVVFALGFLGLVFCSALVLAQVNSGAITPATTTNTGLTVWFPVTVNQSNILLDSTTNHLNGYFSINYTAAYGPGPSTNTTGLYVGPGDAAYVPLKSSTLTNSYSAFTYATWFRYAPVNKGDVETEIASGTDTATNTWSIYVDAEGLTHFALTDSQGKGQSFASIDTNASMFDGGWHQITGVVQSNTAQLYVDDTASQTTVKWAGTNSVNLGLGSTNALNPGFILSDTRLYNRALQPAEVDQLQASDIPASSSSSSPSTTSNSAQTSKTQVAGGIHPLVSGNLFTISAGNNQIIAASTFAANSLQVKLTNSSGTAISGTSISFALASGSDGGLATTSGGTTASTQTVTTNSSGIATIYYKSGSDSLKNNSITATDTADSLVVTLTEHCGTQTGLSFWVSADQGVTQSGGLVSSWVDQSVSGHNITQSTGASQPTYVSSDSYIPTAKPALRFAGSQWLANTVNLGLNADMTIISVHSSTSGTANEYAAWLGNNSGTSSRGIGYFNGASTFSAYGTYITGPAEPNLNSYNIEMATLNSSLNQVTPYLNGIAGTASAISGLQAMTPNITVGSLSGGSYNWQGDISEVLVYSHQLNSTEIASVNQYLGDKYGIYTPNATWYNSAPYNASNIQAEIIRNQWNETQANAYIALQSNTSGVVTHGLLSWFHADSITGLSNGAAVTSWTDSALGNNATQTTGSNEPAYVSSDSNGQPALRFNGSQWLYNPKSLGSGVNQDMTMIAFGSSTTPGNHQYSIGIGQTTQYLSRALGYFNGAQDAATYGSDVYGGAVPNANSLIMEEWTLNPALNQFTFYRNGLQTAQVSTSIAHVPVTAGITVGGVTPSNLFGWQGDIQEVLVYDHQLTSTEMAQVNQYLGDKYGVYTPTATWYTKTPYSTYQTEITRNQWNKTQANAYISLQSNTSGVVTNGLLTWFHADSITGLSNGAAVTSWTDSALGNNATQTTGSNEPTYVSSDSNGQPALRFNGSQWLYNPNSLGSGVNQDMTMIAFGSSTTPGNQQYSIGIGQTTQYLSRSLGYFNGTQDAATYGSDVYGGAVPTANSLVMEEWTLNSALNQFTFYRNGLQTAQVSTSIAHVPVTAGITVGGLTPSNLFGWQGDIQEVLVYDHQLTSTEMAQVNQYLGDKYGVYTPTATWYTKTPYSTYQTEITRNQWNKAQANAYISLQSNTSGVVTNGLLTWFHADSITGLSNGAAVTSWTDSALGNNATQTTGSNEPAYVSSDSNGQPALRFNGSQWLYNPNSLGSGVNQDMTMIAFGSSTTPGNQQYAIGIGQTTQYLSRSLGYFNGTQDAATYDGDVYGGAIPNSNSLVMEEWTLNSALNQFTFYRNGLQTAQVSTSIAHVPVTAGITVGGVTPSNLFGWQGDIQEVLVYDHQLTSTEMGQVNQYLGDKYGVYTPTATWYTKTPYSTYQTEITRNQWNKTQANAYIALQSNTSGVVTTGLLSWFHADSITGLSNGAAVTSWTDTALGNNVTQSTTTSQPSYVASSNESDGQPALHFSGGQILYNPNSLGQGIQNDISLIEVLSTSNTGANQFPFYTGQYGTGTSRGLGYYGSNQYFTTYANDISGAPVPNANTFVTQAVTLDTTLTKVAFYQNGIQTASGTIGAAGHVGYGINVGATQQGFNVQGDIQEILVYDHSLTTAEMNQVNLYISNKYGLYSPQQTGIWYDSAPYNAANIQSEIIRNQWSKQQANTYIALQNNTSGVVTNGLLSWFHADSVTGLSNGAAVTSWTDTALGNNVTQSTTTSQPSYVASSNESDGQPALHFSGGQILYNPNSLGQGIQNDISLIEVLSTSNTGANQFPFYTGQYGTGTSRGLGYYGSNQYFTTYANDVSGAPVPNANTFVTQAVTLDTTLTKVAFYQNGIQTASGTIGAAGHVGYGINVGATQQGFNVQGDIQEILVYDHSLTTAEMNQVNLYISNKYGLYSPQQTGIWYDSAPYNAAGVQSEIIRNQWSKVQANAYIALQTNTSGVVTTGLLDWYNVGTITGVANGAAVTSWSDQGVNALGVSQSTTTSQPTFVTTDSDGKPAVHFSGSQWLSNSSKVNGVNADMTIVQVATTSNPNTNQDSPYIGSTGASTGRGFAYNGSTEYMTTYANDASGGAPPNANVFASEMVTLGTNVQTVNFYQNGLLTATKSLPSPASNVQAGMTIGGVLGGSYLWQGDIQEVLIYDHALTTTEIQKLSVYLAAKYGLNLTVPPPVITPNGGSFSSTVSISFTGQIAPCVVRYTLDGSIPTATSNLYTGAFNLTGSAPVNCAIFLNSVMVSPVTTAQFYVGDTGNIGITDAWQTKYFGHTGINPSTVGINDLTYLQDYLYGYNPTLYSTNGDGLSDLVNHMLGYAGTNLDIDGDGLTNAQELIIGTNPFKADTDGDGHNDGVDYYPLDPTRWQAPTPNPNDHTAPTVNLTYPPGAVRQ